MTAPVEWTINGRFATQPRTGVQRYAGEIARAIDARLVADAGLARRMRWRMLVPADCDTPPRYGAITVARSPRGRGHLWEQTVLPAAAMRGGLVNLANLGPLAHPRQILCLHDANVFLEPTSYSRGFRTAYRLSFPALARRARSVTTVSTFSAAMLRQFGVTGRTDAGVIGNGHEHALRWDATASRFAAPGFFRRPFVFALGSRAKHKRLDLLIELSPALDALGIDLVVSGGTSSIFRPTAAAANEGAGPANVFFVGFVDDDDLAALFARALCFAFPSRTEGFGLPLLEAMVHGAPVVASRCASMPEVCGDAALLVPPDEPDLWLAAIRRLAEDVALGHDLRQRGRRRFPRFSWAAGADHYLALAQSLSPETAEGRASRRDPAALPHSSN